MNSDWLALPYMRAQYQKSMQQYEMLQMVETVPSAAQDRLKSELWTIKLNVYRILAKAVGTEPDEAVEREAAPFGWSLEQLTSEILREWLLH